MIAAAMAMPAMIQPHGVELDDLGAAGATVVVGAAVVGAAVVGAAVVGATVVGAAVVGAAVVGAAVVGAAVVGAAVVGAAVVGAATPVVGASVTVVIGPSLPPVVVGPSAVVVGRRLVVGRATVLDGDGLVIDVTAPSSLPPLPHAAGRTAAIESTTPPARSVARLGWRGARRTAPIPAAAAPGVTTRDE
jgi:hypothetical protein